jgi:hypothetical protein
LGRSRATLQSTDVLRWLSFPSCARPLHLALPSHTLQWLAGAAPPQYAEVGPYTFKSSEVRYNLRYDAQWNQVRAGMWGRVQGWSQLLASSKIGSKLERHASASSPTARLRLDTAACPVCLPTRRYNTRTTPLKHSSPSCPAPPAPWTTSWW